MKKNDLIVTCCFCGQSLTFDVALEISIKTDKTTDEWQTVYSHTKCLDDRLNKDVPRLFEVTD